MQMITKTKSQQLNDIILESQRDLAEFYYKYEPLFSEEDKLNFMSALLKLDIIKMNNIFNQFGAISPN